MTKKSRRSKKSAAARVRPFWILILLALIAAGAAGSYAAGWPGFRPKTIAVYGALVVPRSQIVARAGIDARSNLWLQSMGRAADRIKAIPYIDDVHIHRSLPANVSIAVTERKPFALVRGAKTWYVVDRRLRVLQGAGASMPLPILMVETGPAIPGETISGERIHALVRDVETLEQVHVVPRQLSYDRLGDLLVTLNGAVLVQFGDDTSLLSKASLVDPILSQTQRAGKRVRAIDLRAPKTPVVVFK